MSCMCAVCRLSAGAGADTAGGVPHGHVQRNLDGPWACTGEYGARAVAQHLSRQVLQDLIGRFI